MSVLSHARTRLLVCCVAATAALGALAFAPAAGAAKVGSTYLALGDSLAYGYHQAQFQSELKSKGFVEPATFNDGYNDVFAGILKFVNPKLEYINDGCPGETTETFIHGPGAPYTGAYCAGGPTGTPFPYVWLHHPYTTSSQLEDALAILKANPNVSPISLDMGSNDVLQFLENTCGFPKTYTCTEAQVIAEFGHIAANVGYILTQLHAAAPHAQIVFVGAYNPYPTVLPPPGGDATTKALDSAIASVVASVPGASYVDNLQWFNYAGTHGKPESGDIPTICAFTAMCPGGTFNPTSPEADIHPTKLGYLIMGLNTSFDFFTH
jgi:lysophospholipase L1-like esterase